MRMYLGAMCERVTESIHPSYFKLAQDIFNLFPGMHYLGVDLLIKNIHAPVQNENYRLIELTTYPGYSLLQCRVRDPLLIF